MTHYQKYIKPWRKRNRGYHRDWQRRKRGNFDMKGRERSFILGVHVRTNLLEMLSRPMEHQDVAR